MATQHVPTVLLAGGTGLVGRAFAQLLLEHKPPPRLVQLVRRVPADADPRASWLAVDFNALPKTLPPAQFACCCLGTTIKQAGSQQAFRAVDLDAVLAFARAARAAGATRFAVVSALGASAGSAVFYNRVKAEMEAGVATVGFDGVVIARPSLLLGEREALGQPARPGERLAAMITAPFGWLMPGSVRPIEAATVARALWRALQQDGPGVRVIESGQLQQLGAPA